MRCVRVRVLKAFPISSYRDAQFMFGSPNVNVHKHTAVKSQSCNSNSDGIKWMKGARNFCRYQICRFPAHSWIVALILSPVRYTTVCLPASSRLRGALLKFVAESFLQFHEIRIGLKTILYLHSMIVWNAVGWIYFLLYAHNRVRSGAGVCEPGRWDTSVGKKLTTTAETTALNSCWCRVDLQATPLCVWPWYDIWFCEFRVHHSLA